MSACIVSPPIVASSVRLNPWICTHGAHARRPWLQVYDTPDSHVTRDWRQARAQLGDLSFTALDTSGLQPDAHPDSLAGRANALTRRVLAQAHLALMIVDAK